VAFYRQLLESARALPGVEAAGTTSKLPLDFGNSLSFSISGRPEPEPGQYPGASWRQASTDYFRALRIPVLEGRVFTDSDDPMAPSVGVVNRVLVETYFRGEDPLGRVLRMGPTDSVRIVGVVGDVPIGNLGDRIPPTLYVPFAQVPQASMSIVIRTTATLGETSRAFHQLLARLDGDAALTAPTSMEDLLVQSPSVFMRRFPLLLVGTFAVATLVLALVGVYGVVSYSVAQRTREMGIRLALGARPASLIALVVRQGTWIAATGVILGTTAAVVLSRYVEKMLYGVHASDPSTYAAVALLLGAAAILAAVFPARRATRVDPVSALRAE